MGNVRCPTERFRSALPFQIIASELCPAARRDPAEGRAAPFKGEQAVSLFQDRKAFAGEMDADLFVEAVTGFFIDFHSLTSYYLFLEIKKDRIAAITACDPAWKKRYSDACEGFESFWFG